MRHIRDPHIAFEQIFLILIWLTDRWTRERWVPEWWELYIIKPIAIFGGTASLQHAENLRNSEGSSIVPESTEDWPKNLRRVGL